MSSTFSEVVEFVRGSQNLQSSESTLYGLMASTCMLYQLHPVVFFKETFSVSVMARTVFVKLAREQAIPLSKIAAFLKTTPATVRKREMAMKNILTSKYKTELDTKAIVFYNTIKKQHGKENS